MTVRVTDPFGLVELGRAFHTTAPLMVTPRTVPLPAIPLGGAWTGSGDNRPRAFATGSAEDVTVREYRRGDDLRRVHWRSSRARRRADGASRGAALAVARHPVPRQPAQSRTAARASPPPSRRRSRWPRRSPSTSSQRGFTVRLVTAPGEEPGRGLALPGRRAQHRTRCSRRWPSSSRPPHHRIDTGWLAEATHGGLVVAVLGGRSTESDTRVLRRMQHHAGTALAIDLDVDRLDPAARPDRSGGRRCWPGRAGARSPWGPATGSTPSGRTSGRLAGRGAGSPRPASRSDEHPPAAGPRSGPALASRRRPDDLGDDAVLARLQRRAGPLPRAAAARRAARWPCSERCCVACGCLPWSWSPGRRWPPGRSWQCR